MMGDGRSDRQTTRVTSVTTDISRGCEHCSFLIHHDDLAGAINHYLGEHGYFLLHIGCQTDIDYTGKSYASTIAVLGSDKPPPVLDVNSHPTIHKFDEEL